MNRDGTYFVGHRKEQPSRQPPRYPLFGARRIPWRYTGRQGSVPQYFRIVLQSHRKPQTCHRHATRCRGFVRQSPASWLVGHARVPADVRRVTGLYLQTTRTKLPRSPCEPKHVTWIAFDPLLLRGNRSQNFVRAARLPPPRSNQRVIGFRWIERKRKSRSHSNFGWARPRWATRLGSEPALHSSAGRSLAIASGVVFGS